MREGRGGSRVFERISGGHDENVANLCHFPFPRQESASGVAGWEVMVSRQWTRRARTNKRLRNRRRARPKDSSGDGG